jgi:DNA (cytosine-5)-methyltransferase 1
MLKHASLFSGIGGFDLAAEWAGWENIFHCEWNPFGQKVLAHHFPNSKSYNDITKTNFTIHEGTVDVLTGGFPCQPYSQAGKRLGKADDRHLWPEMLRTIREVKPRWVVGENVLGIVNWNGGMVFEEVQLELEAQGYEVQSYILPAAGVNAPHQRYRTWFVAYSNDKGRCSEFRSISKKDGEISQRDKNAKFSNSSDRITAYTKNIRQPQAKTFSEWQEYKSNNRDFVWNTFSTISRSKNVANPNGFGLQGKWEQRSIDKKGERRNERFGKLGNNEFGRWEEFPTKPSICGGDDGISRSMDGITFSKWRNESIKAYGNAIVPQVAYEIFKAIIEFELSAK